VQAEALRAYSLKTHDIMVGRGGKHNAAGEAVSFRIAHFGRAAEPARIERMIDITTRFMAGASPA
jgi:hypothetical protein